MILPRDRVRRYTGFGMVDYADSYMLPVTDEEQMLIAFQFARSVGRQIVIRGNGRSYGDANIGREQIALNTTGFNKIRDFDSQGGLVDVDPGVTVEQLWQTTIPAGWWVPVVAGTAQITIGGALAMNIHGKNQFSAGTLAEHVAEIDVITPMGGKQTFPSSDPRFRDFIGTAGLVGFISRIRLKLKKLNSGDLDVIAIHAGSWEQQFAVFNHQIEESDYMVSWIDMLAGGNSGRGLVHTAKYREQHEPETLELDHQIPSNRVAKIIPKSLVWRVLRAVQKTRSMRLVNAAKYTASKVRAQHGFQQPIAQFSFLLDSIPHWRRAYEPHGFVQFQAFLPKEDAQDRFKYFDEITGHARIGCQLAVMKRHRPDGFLLSPMLDGYSLAMDFAVNPAREAEERILWDVMAEEVVRCGGRFYLAKDGVLTQAQYAAAAGPSQIAQLKLLRDEHDPDRLLTSELAKRLGLD